MPSEGLPSYRDFTGVAKRTNEFAAKEAGTVRTLRFTGDVQGCYLETGTVLLLQFAAYNHCLQVNYMNVMSTDHSHINPLRSFIILTAKLPNDYYRSGRTAHQFRCTKSAAQCNMVILRCRWTLTPLAQHYYTKLGFKENASVRLINAQASHDLQMKICPHLQGRNPVKIKLFLQDKLSSREQATSVDSRSLLK